MRLLSALDHFLKVVFVYFMKSHLHHDHLCVIHFLSYLFFSLSLLSSPVILFLAWLLPCAGTRDAPTAAFLSNPMLIHLCQMPVVSTSYWRSPCLVSVALSPPLLRRPPPPSSVEPPKAPSTTEYRDKSRTPTLSFSFLET